MTETFFKNFSFDIFHASPAEGKYPHLLFFANTDEPSARMVNVAE